MSSILPEILARGGQPKLIEAVLMLRYGCKIKMKSLQQAARIRVFA
jgi:hypothetical protein